MDLFGFCHPTDLPGLGNCFCVFRFGKFCRYWLFLVFDFGLLYLDSDLSGLWKHLMQQGIDVVLCADLCFYVH